MAKAENVYLEVEVKHATDKAILVVYEEEDIWIPISQIVLDETSVKFEKGEKGSLCITKWIAEQKGLAD